MCKSSIFYILSVTLLINGCSNSKQSVTSTNYQREYETFSDTSVNIRMDTSLSYNTEGIKSLNDSVALKYLSPWFVKDICEPGNYTHPVYKGFYQKGLMVRDEALKDFLFRISTDNKLIEQLKERNINDKDFNNIELKQLFVYSIVPNIILYKTGEDLKNYYTLDTSAVVLRVVKNQNTFIVLNFVNNRCNLIPLYAGDSLSFLQVKSAYKEPIALVNEIKFPGKNISTFFDNLGFIANEQLFMTNCDAGSYTIKKNQADTGRIVYRIDCNTTTVNRYTQSKGGQAYLRAVINRGSKVLKNTMSN